MGPQLNPNYGPITLFSPTLWKYQYHFDWSRLEKKVEESFRQIKKNSDLEAGDAWSTVSLDKTQQPHSWSELQSFIAWLELTVTGIANDLHFQTYKFQVANSWINKHSYSGKTLEHNHNNCTFVASCYIECPKDSGNIVFKDPLEYHKSHWPIYPEEHCYQEISVSTSDILIFPGYMKHYVTENQTDRDRYVLTVNIL